MIIIGNHFSYIVYSKYEVEASDTSYINQATNGGQEITLLTCDNANGKRLIIKAKRV